jgi:spermidine synthase
MQARQPALSIGAIGMGAGTVATYTRPGDKMRFFEIDPLVVRVASDPKQFSYINGCAKGHVDTVLGDARLSLASEAPAAFDLLLVDAFSSDSVPAHMLTVEAIRLYLDRIRPDGVVAMHLSNHNLELLGPVASAAREAGAVALVQRYRPKQGETLLAGSGTDVILMAHNERALAPFRDDPRWAPAKPGAPYWTDDYTNLVGALVRKMGEKPVP